MPDPARLLQAATLRFRRGVDTFGAKP